MQQFRQWRQIKIPFQQRWDNSEMLISFFQQPPYRGDHIRPMGIHNQIFRFFVMTSNVNIANSLRWQLFLKCIGIVTVIDAVNVNIVNIQQ